MHVFKEYWGTEMSFASSIYSFFRGPTARQTLQRAESLYLKVLKDSKAKDIVSLSQEAQKQLKGLKVIHSVEDITKLTGHEGTGGVYLSGKKTILAKDAYVFCHELVHACQYRMSSFWMRSRDFLIDKLSAVRSLLFPTYVSGYNAYFKINNLTDKLVNKTLERSQYVTQVRELLRGLTSKARQCLKKHVLDEIQAYRLTLKHASSFEGGAGRLEQDIAFLDFHKMLNREVRAAERLSKNLPISQ